MTTFLGMPVVHAPPGVGALQGDEAFPTAARRALADTQLRRNIGRATSTIRAKRAAVVADCTAMSASCSASGSGLTAQSPYTSTRSARHMKKTEETIDASGRVLITSKAGRTVAAVEWAAPETMPSASPSRTMSVPK